jgi:type II secretory pathway pseudopilin PulG
MIPRHSIRHNDGWFAVLVRHRKDARRRTQSRSGFTILELLIAVGLTSILMMALFSAMSIYFDLQLDSHEEITREQIARTLFRQMSRDIQSVVFVKQKLVDDGTSGTSTSQSGSSSSSSTGSSTSGSGSSSSGTSGSGSGSTSTGGTGSTTGGTTGSSGASSTGSTSSSSSSSLDGNSYGESSVDPETALMTYTNGLVGTANDLQLFISRPDRNLSYVSSQELTSTTQRTSDLFIVRYLMAQKGGGGLASAIAEREDQSGETGAIGLAKMQGDLFGLSTAVATDEDVPQVGASSLLAREVSSLQFRYFDGLSWQEQWDSTALNELPKAIEIVLTLRNQQSSGTAFSEDSVDAYAYPDSKHRMVVQIPVAEPFSMSETAL